jgi:hypothetical protein
MKKYKFTGIVPALPEAAELFHSTLARFAEIKARLAGFLGSELPTELVEQLADEFKVDRFLIEDVFRVLKGYVNPELDPTAAGTFWTLGRKEPRWGMPWASITIDGIDVTINIRWDGSFSDIEDPPLTVGCRIEFRDENLSSIEPVLFASKQFDLWLQVEGQAINGVLVADR